MNKKDKENLTELERTIEDFFSGKLNNSKGERRYKKSNNNCVNHKNFPDKSAFRSPQRSALPLLPSAASFYLHFNDLKGRLF